LIPVLGAVLLPWVAVVIANGSDKAEIHSDSLLDYALLAELDAPAPTGTAEPYPADGGDGPERLLQGELMDDENDDDDHGRAAS
jgi:hypothetical protein